MSPQLEFYLPRSLRHFDLTISDFPLFECYTGVAVCLVTIFFDRPAELETSSAINNSCVTQIHCVSVTQINPMTCLRTANPTALRILRHPTANPPTPHGFHTYLSKIVVDFYDKQVLYYGLEQ